MLLFALLLVESGFASTVFQDNFENYPEGSAIVGQGGWLGRDIGGGTLVTTGPMLGTKIVNSRTSFGFGQAYAYRLIPKLDMNSVYLLSFDAYADSRPFSHNSGLNFTAGIESLAGWHASNNPNTGVPLASWGFVVNGVALYLPGGFDKPVRLETIIDPRNQQAYGRARFGSGSVIETPRLALPREKIEKIDRIEMNHDFRFLGPFIGIEMDNIRLSVSPDGAPVTASVMPSRGGNTGSVTITIAAPGIKPGGTVRLIGALGEITAHEIAEPSPRTIRATLDLNGAPPGLRTVVIQNLDFSIVTLPGAFTIEEGGSSQVRVYKGGSRAVPGRILDYTILVENIGTIDDIGRDITELIDVQRFELISVNPPARTDVRLNPEAILWEIPRIAAGEAIVLSYRARLKPETPLGIDVIGGPVCRELVEKARSDLLSCLARVYHSASCTAQETICLATTPICLSGAVGLPLCATRTATCLYGLLDCGVSRQERRAQCFENHLRNARCGDHVQRTAAPKDPNEKVVVAPRYIRPDQTLLYVTHYENIGSAEAKDVFITDQLDPNLDITTLTPIGIAPLVDVTNRTLKWELFNRNLEPRATDKVMFSIKPKPGLPSGTVIRNKATIQFEIFESLTTEEVMNVIDTTKPSCNVAKLPSQTTNPKIALSWAGTDSVGEISAFRILVSTNGGSFNSLIDNTINTSMVFTGEPDNTYAFQCVATDTVGNIETVSATAEAMTRIVKGTLPGDLNADGKIDCGDLAIVKSSFGKRKNAVGFDVRADVNRDAIVDVRDLAFVSQQLAAGTKCQ